MTFRACEAVFSYYAKTQRQLKHMDLKKTHRFKNKEAQWAFFLPSSTWATGGSGPRRSGGRTQVKRRNVIIPQAHARSKLQHKNKSFTEARYERDFEPLGTEAASLDICDLFLDLGSPVALGDSFECVLKGVAPADSELKCSTEQCCTEYLWHWNSCEFFCHHRCLEGFLHCCVLFPAAPRLFTCSYTVRHVLVDYCHLSSTSKHRHMLQILADVTMAQSLKYNNVKRGKLI